MSNFGRKRANGNSSLCIAVIDDDPLIRGLMVELLEDDGHFVVCFASPRAALVACDETEFDAVLCDIVMPEMSGIELVQRLCLSRPEYRRRMVMLTGDPFAPDTQDFLVQTGCLYLSKPFRRAQLTAALATVAAADGSVRRSPLPRAA